MSIRHAVESGDSAAATEADALCAAAPSVFSVPTCVAGSAARAGAGAGVALQPRRAPAGRDVPGVAGVVRAVLGGEPGAAEGEGGRGEGVRKASGSCSL